jgi:hypothetical protein
MVDDLIGFAAVALVGLDGLDQVGRASIMQKEDALSDAPQRSRSEFVWASAALRNPIGQAFAHVVNEQIGKKIYRLI